MPKLIVSEKDNTSAGNIIYSNFAVVVPGFRNNDNADVFDANGIYECNSLKDFKENIGCVDPARTITAGEVKFNHYGNQIAYELLKLGYTVLYKDLGHVTAAGDSGYTTTLDLDTLTESETWIALADRANYDFRYVIHGFIESPEEKEGFVGQVNEAIANLAAYVKNSEESLRGDCTALLDVDEAIYKELEDISQKGVLSATIDEINKYTFLSTNEVGKYASLNCPSVIYSGLTYDNSFKYTNAKFPASFHYLACFARMLSTDTPEWFAVAGLTRGKSDYTVASTRVQFGSIAMNALEPRTYTDGNNGPKYACNVIMKIKNSYYLYGNRTAYELNETGLKASHFLNIRQLCSTLNKQVYTTCSSLMFDPNSDVLWVNFCNKCRPVLESMKANQGINDYLFVKLAADEKAKMSAKIRIIPIEAVEDFDINLSLEDSFGTVNTSISE